MPLFMLYYILLVHKYIFHMAMGESYEEDIMRNGYCTIAFFTLLLPCILFLYILATPDTCTLVLVVHKSWSCGAKKNKKNIIISWNLINWSWVMRGKNKSCLVYLEFFFTKIVQYNFIECCLNKLNNFNCLVII